MEKQHTAGSVFRSLAIGGALAAGLMASPVSNADTTLMLNGWAGPTQQLTRDILLGWAHQALAVA